MGDVYFYFACDDVAVLGTRILVHFPIQEGGVRTQSRQGHERLAQEENLDISSPVLLHWADTLNDGAA